MSSDKTQPTRQKKRKRRAAESEITVDVMETYVKFKSFDVIGNGTYRRYVNSCKEKGEQWAVKMTQGFSPFSITLLDKRFA